MSTPGTPSIPSSSSIPPEEERLYDLYRDYTKHEDDLINHRATWHGTWQGLLFTAFGVVITAKAEGQKLAPVIIAVRLLVPMLGLWIAGSALISLNAAWKAIRSIRRKWDLEVVPTLNSVVERLPKLTGGGDPEAEENGTKTRFVPHAVIFVWAVILAATAVQTFQDVHGGSQSSSSGHDAGSQAGKDDVSKRLTGIEDQLKVLSDRLTSIQTKPPRKIRPRSNPSAAPTKTQ